MTYEPFITGTGRINDKVHIEAKYYRIARVDDLILGPFGWNAAATAIQIGTVFNALAAAARTQFRAINETNVAEGRLLQITGIGINAGPKLRCYLRQPAAMSRMGTQRATEGILDARNSPVGAPKPLSWLFTFKEKPIYLDLRNDNVSINVIPELYMYGFHYLLEDSPKPPVFFEIVLGGIE